MQRSKQAHFLVSLATSPLDFALTATPRMPVFQSEPARLQARMLCQVLTTITKDGYGIQKKKFMF